jgi:NTE family protein
MKRAVVLSGGGAKGAYQAGALAYLVGNLERQYDIVCGVSVGALNAAMLAMHPIGQERSAAAEILNIWRNITTKSVRKNWMPFAFLHALWKPSLYNSQPLIDFVNERMNVTKIKASGKKLVVGAVALASGEYRSFDETHPNIVDAVLASSSFPAMLRPIEIEGQLWSDGGVRNVTPLKEAIDAGADEIDVIMTSPERYNASFSENPNTIDVAIRAIDIMGDEVVENDIKIAELFNRLVSMNAIADGKRYIKIRVLRPTQKLPGKSLDFEQKEIRQMIDLGFNDAVKFLT